MTPEDKLQGPSGAHDLDIGTELDELHPLAGHLGAWVPLQVCDWCQEGYPSRTWSLTPVGKEMGQGSARKLWQ